MSKLLTNDEIMLFNKKRKNNDRKTNPVVNKKKITKETKINTPVTKKPETD